VTVTVYTAGAVVEVIDTAPPPAGFVPVLTKTDANAPSPTPADQTLVLNLHASGGPQLAFGDQWKANVAEPYASIANPMTWAVQGKADGIYLQPHDRFYTAAGKLFESYWVGYVVGTEMRLYAESRLDRLMAWVDAQYPQASKTKRVAAGGSMGAWGCMTYALRRPTMFAAVFASRPRWKVGSAVQGENGNGTSSVVGTVRGSSATIIEHHDSIAYISNPANKAPPVIFCLGRRDGFAPFADAVAAVVASRATKRFVAFAWNDGDHSGGDILGTLGYTYAQFELGRGYPLLTGCSHDKDPAVDLVGTINAGFAWRNVVETADAWSCEITNTQATTVTVEPRSSVFVAAATPKTISIAAGQWVAVAFAKVVVPPPIPSVVVTKTLNPSKMISVAGWIPGADRYYRGQDLTVLRPDANGRAKVRIFGFDQAAGGLVMWWDGVRAVLNAARTAWIRPLGADGQPLPAQRPPMALTLHFETPQGVRSIAATAATDPLAIELFFDVDCAPIADGWYKATVTGCEGDGWSVADYGVYVLKGATAQPHTLCPSVTTSYEFVHPAVAGSYLHQFAWVPAMHAPNYVAFPLRTYPPVALPIKREKLVMLEVGANRLADIHRPVQSAEGIWTTFHTQHYMFSDFERALPSQPLLDGRRGIGTTAGLMHIEWGTAVVPSPPFNGPVGNLYFTDTWRFGKVLMGDYRGEDRGRVITLCGYRHKAPPAYRAPLGHNLELVGNWDAIPPARHGFRRLWGIAWDSRAFVSDTNAPTIPAEKDLHPHATWANHDGATMTAGIRVFLPDMGGNRICKLQFDPQSHATPPVVTEFVVGLSEVFDCIELGKGSGILAATVRKQNRVVFICMDDGRIVAEFATPGPEGIAYQDGVLYYGSLAASNIKKRDASSVGDIVTLGAESVAVTLTRPNQINDNSNYVKIALSDGSLFPRGSIAKVCWSNIHSGLPMIWGPDGVGIDWLGLTSPWSKVKGPPSMYEGSRGYQTAVGFGPGRMFASTVQESLVQFSAALPTDADTPNVAAGYKKYMARGFHLTRGFHGWHYGEGIPWDVDPDIDAFLAAYGHSRT
jgi:hypothetical protein